MTIARRLEHRTIWKCDECGKEDAWENADWTCYSSILMEENIIEDVPTMCSDACRDKFMKKMKSGEVVVPKAIARGWSNVKIIGERKGY